MFRYYEELEDEPQPELPRRRHVDPTMLIGQWRERLVLLTVGVAILVVLGTGVVVAWPYSSKKVSSAMVGNVLNFPIGSITFLQLPVAFVDPVLPLGQTTAARYSPNHPIPIYMSNDATDGLMAFFGRDTFRGCRFQWLDLDKRFIDPCHGSAYTQSGVWVRGPAQRNLDQFGVRVGSDGTVNINVQDFRVGVKH